MKYKAGYIKAEGKWAVTSNAGKRYFPNSLTESKAAAEHDARIYSMRWHYDQISKLFDEGVDQGNFNIKESWSDYVA